MWMNEYEIEEALPRYKDHPVLGPAVRTLASLVSYTNSHSDGWPYDTKPANAAMQLMDLIQRGREYDRKNGCEYPCPPEPTAADLRKALAPVKAFRTRSGWDFKITEALPSQDILAREDVQDACAYVREAEMDVTAAKQALDYAQAKLSIAVRARDDLVSKLAGKEVHA